MPTVTTPFLMMDPGYIYHAPAGTAFPAAGGTAAGSKFTDAPSVTFIEAGATEDGHRFRYAPSIEPITVAEFLDPVKWRTVSREGSFAFNLADYTLKNLQRGLNGGTLTSTGSGATQVNKLTPPALGQETRSALMWESADATMRIFMYSTVNVAEMEMAFNKAPAIAVIPCEFRFELDGSGNLFDVYGTNTRLGV
jgi:hypothetical protein